MLLLKSALTPMAVLRAPVVLSNERACAQTGVGLRSTNPSQRERENEYSNNDGQKRSSVGRIDEAYNALPVCLLSLSPSCGLPKVYRFAQKDCRSYYKPLARSNPSAH